MATDPTGQTPMSGTATAAGSTATPAPPNAGAPKPVTPAPHAPDVLQARSCPHCGATGTCRNGKNQTSCVTCVRYYLNLKAPTIQDKAADEKALTLEIVTKCSVCVGRGFTEGLTYKIRSYFPFAFAVLFIAISFLAIWHLPATEDKLKTSLMTLVSTIVGFYFGGKASTS